MIRSQNKPTQSKPGHHRSLAPKKTAGKQMESTSKRTALADLISEESKKELSKLISLHRKTLIQHFQNQLATKIFSMSSSLRQGAESQKETQESRQSIKQNPKPERNLIQKTEQHQQQAATAQETAAATEHRKRYPEQSSRP